MAIIQTERNSIHAHACGDDDVFVRVSWVGYDEAGGRVLRHLRYEPITEYQAAVDWAVSMADKMAHQLHVVPFNADDMREPSRFQPFCDAVASMDDQQRGAMRHIVVTTCCEVMRDCDDPEIRDDMFDVLRQLKVIHHES
ncbi:MAG TPA: hypothetical protein VF463_16945 [Sphingobium sp.]